MTPQEAMTFLDKALQPQMVEKLNRADFANAQLALSTLFAVVNALPPAVVPEPVPEPPKE